MTEMLQAPGTIYTFNVGVEDLVATFADMEDASSLERVPAVDLVKRKGRPWKGIFQRGQRLSKYIVSVFGRPGDTDLDLFAGSGTLRLVAAFMDCNVIMLDKDEIYDHRLLAPYYAC